MISVYQVKWLHTVTDGFLSSQMTGPDKLGLIWVPQHHGLEGNEKSDECTVSG